MTFSFQRLLLFLKPHGRLFLTVNRRESIIRTNDLTDELTSKHPVFYKQVLDERLTNAHWHSILWTLKHL